MNEHAYCISRTTCASACSRVRDQSMPSHVYAGVCHSIVLLRMEAAICLCLACRGRSAAKHRLSRVGEGGMEELAEDPNEDKKDGKTFLIVYLGDYT